MKERNLRQIDILNLTMPYCEQYGIKFNKSDLSQYISGKTEPNQDKLAILGMALNVSESWLMGFDVPMTRIESISVDNQNDLKKLSNEVILIESIQNVYGKETVEVLQLFQRLNEFGKKKAIEYISDITSISKYKDDITTNEAFIYRAARSSNNSEPEIIKDSKSRISKFEQARKVTDSNDL